MNESGQKTCAENVSANTLETLVKTCSSARYRINTCIAKIKSKK